MDKVNCQVFDDIEAFQDKIASFYMKKFTAVNLTESQIAEIKARSANVLHQVMIQLCKQTQFNGKATVIEPKLAYCFAMPRLSVTYLVVNAINGYPVPFYLRTNIADNSGEIG